MESSVFISGNSGTTGWNNSPFEQVVPEVVPPRDARNRAFLGTLVTTQLKNTYSTYLHILQENKGAYPRKRAYSRVIGNFVVVVPRRSLCWKKR